MRVHLQMKILQASLSAVEFALSSLVLYLKSHDKILNTQKMFSRVTQFKVLNVYTKLYISIRNIIAYF